MAGQKSKQKTKIPIHIVKRPAIEWWKSWLIRAAAIIIALVISGGILFFISKTKEIDPALLASEGRFGVFKKIMTDAVKTVYQASFGTFNPKSEQGYFAQVFTSRKFWGMLQDLSMLLCIALAVTPAFKMKYWNLGAQGQVLFGGLCSVSVMFYLNSGYWETHKWLVIVLMLAAAIIGGIIWAVIPAIFKSIWNTNESLFTLMMNYIAIQLVTCMINVWVPSGSSVMGVVNQKTKIGWMPQMKFPEAWNMSSAGENYFYNIVIVLVLTVVMYVYFKYSKHGYEISVVGESVNTAKYIGINVKKVIIRTLVLSGMICGLAGFLLVSGTDHSIAKTLDRGYGFTAIIVSWLAKFNPVVMLLTSFLIVFLDRGAGDMAMTMGFNKSVSDIITGVIIFFIIGCEFFINYKIVLRHKEGALENGGYH